MALQLVRGEILSSPAFSLVRGPQKCGFFYDFLGNEDAGAGDLADFLVAVNGTSAAVSANVDAKNGAITLTTGTDDNGYAQIQYQNEVVLFEAGKTYAFGARFKYGEATQSDLFFGLAPIQADPTASNQADIIAIKKDDGDLNWDIKTTADGSAIDDYDTSKDAVASTYEIWSFIVDVKDATYADINVFKDGTNVYALETSKLPNTEVAPFIIAKAGAATTSFAITLDAMWGEWDR